MNFANHRPFEKLDFNACTLAAGLLKAKVETEWPPFQRALILRPPSGWSVDQIQWKYPAGELLLDGRRGSARPMNSGWAGWKPQDTGMIGWKQRLKRNEIDENTTNFEDFSICPGVF